MKILTLTLSHKSCYICRFLIQYLLIIMFIYRIEKLKPDSSNILNRRVDWALWPWLTRKTEFKTVEKTRENLSTLLSKNSWQLKEKQKNPLRDMIANALNGDSIIKLLKKVSCLKANCSEVKQKLKCSKFHLLSLDLNRYYQIWIKLKMSGK